MSTLKTITVIHPSSAVNNITNDASGNVAVGGTVGMASSFKRNILINGNFLINQRVYVSGTATAAGTYMHDRWKSTQSGSYYTFTQGTPDTTITIVSGAIAQIVENVNVAGGVYTLSWTGTATARGSYAASPITTSSATAGQQITVEFSTGTCGLVQLEPGTKATTYERQIYSDQLAQCQRYYTKSYDVGTAPGTASTSAGAIGNTLSAGGVTYTTGSYKVSMRTTPTVVVYNGTTGGTGTWSDGGGGSPATSVNLNGSNGVVMYSSGGAASSTIFGHYTASAEL